MIKNFKKKIDAHGLAIFRIFYSAILFLEISQLFNYREIIYSAKDTFGNYGEFNPTFIFGFWFFIVGMIFLGLFTRFATIVNYLFSVIIFSSVQVFEYHVFYAYVGINFLLIFMPISRVLSFDNLIQKIKYSDTGGFYKVDTKVLAANYLMPVFVGIALVYFDSVLFKFKSPMWMKGLGMWLPANLPMATWSDTTWLMNHEFLVKFLGYLVIIFETIFIFLFWLKPFRVPFMLLGITFHMGILLEFPIPWFALTAVALYLLMVPVSWWKEIGGFFSNVKPSYKFYYDVECPLCIKTVVIIRHFDIFNKVLCLPVQSNYLSESAFIGKSEDELLINIHGVNNKGESFLGYDAYCELLKYMLYTYPIGLFLNLPIISLLGSKIYSKVAANRLNQRCIQDICPMPIIQKPLTETQDYLVKGLNQLILSRKFWSLSLSFFIASQTLISIFSPLSNQLIGLVKVGNISIINLAEPMYKFFKNPLVKYFGITHHAVFMDSHFNGYNHILKTEYHSLDSQVTLVPIINDKGIPEKYIQGAFWVNYTFRVSSPKLSRETFENGIRPYLKFFITERNVTLDQGKFVFYFREIQIPVDWEKDFLRTQMTKPWVKAGECVSNRESISFSWSKEMEAIFKSEKY